MALTTSPFLLPVIAVSLIQSAGLQATHLDLHVSPAGKPHANGSLTAPFSSLSEAVNAFKAQQSERKSSGATVFLADGLYSMPEGVILDNSCSGSDDAHLTITGEPGTSPILTAGRVVLGSQLEPVTDSPLLERLDPAAKEHIRQIDLKKLGVPTVTPLPEVFTTDWMPLIIVHGTNALPISRWPKGEYGYTTMKNVIDNGDKSHGGTFVYRGNHPARWHKAAEDDQLWLRGFWRVPWVINGAKVKSIDTNSCTVTLAKDVGGGIGAKNTKAKDAQGREYRPGNGTEPWHAINLPEEITQPGEWAVDFKRQLVYLWPPEGVSASKPLLLAANHEPLLFLDNVSHVTVKGIRFLCSVADAVVVQNGENDLIAGCEVAHVAHTGISLLGGKHHRAVSNNVRETGNSGILVAGGVKATLQPAGHEVLNNEVSRAAIDCVRAALQVGKGDEGQFQENAVGMRIAHNRIHDSSNTGIRFGGCDNIIEWNEVYRIGLNSADLGGIYGYCGFTGFGNVIRNNFVHHSMNANAFYLDDGTSGVTVEGNVAYKCAMGVLIGGGHYNRFLNNIIADCPKGIHLDDRGITWGNYALGDTPHGRGVRSVSPELPPWKEKHPELAELVAGGETRLPKGDILMGNVLIDCTKPFELPKTENAGGIRVQQNSTNGALSEFPDIGNFDFTIKPGSTLIASMDSFPQVPFHQIGLQKDEYRTSLPPRDNQLLLQGDTTWRKDLSADLETPEKK